MPLASVGVWTVLWSNVLPEFVRRLRPHGQAVVAGVPHEVVRRRRSSVTPGVEVEPVGDLVDDVAVLHDEVVHRAVHPHADLGVLDVEPVDGRVAQGAADAVDLVGVDALAHVTLDGEPGQVHVRRARRRTRPCRRTRRRCGPSRPGAGVDSATSRPADDRVPAAGALDRDVVDDDVPVHLVDARRHVDRQVLLLRERDGLVERVRRSPCGRTGRRRTAARSPP